jgi:biotin carboxyl carrier protein
MMKRLFGLSISLVAVVIVYVSTPNDMTPSELSGDVPVLSAPVKGVWRVINSPGHEAFAYDLAAINPDTKSTLSTSRLAHIFRQTSVKDFYSWGEPVRTPVAGTVMHVSDDVPDRESLNLVLDLVRMLASRPDLSPDDIRPFAGNYIIIDAESFYVFVAHLKSGSIPVEAGDRVRKGQVLGEVGNSGFTLEPHLHIQLVDQVDNLLAATTLPFNIDSFEIMDNGDWNTSSIKSLPKGKIVRFDEEESP